MQEPMSKPHSSDKDELRKSQEILRKIIDHLPQSIFWKDSKGVYLGCNKSFAVNAGFSDSGEIIGKTDHDLPWSAEQTRAFVADDQFVIHQNQAKLNIIEPLLKADGSEIWLETSKVPLSGELGSAETVIGIYQDITERKKQEEELKNLKANLEQQVLLRTEALKKEIELRASVETALKESEFRYRNIVDSSSSIILNWDGEGRILFMNKYGLEFFGFEASELIGRNVVGTIVSPVDSEGYDLEAKMVEVQKRSEDFYSSENENIKKNGEKVWIAWTNKRIYGEDGKLIRILSTGIDRTQQRRVDKALEKSRQVLEETVELRTSELKKANQDLVLEMEKTKKEHDELLVSEEKFRSVFMTIPAGSYITTLEEGRILDTNKEFEQIFGYSMDEVIGKTSLRLNMYANPDDRARIVSLLRQNGIVKNVEVTGRKKDGTLFLASLSIQVMSGKEPPLILGIVRDVTEFRAAEETIRKSQALLSSIVNSKNDLIWSVDPVNFGLTYFNRELEEYFLHERDIQICLGNKPEDLFAKQEYVESWKSMYRKTLDEGSYSIEYLTYFGTRILRLTFNKLIEYQSVFGISVFGEDITNRVAAEKELVKAKEKAEESDRLKSTFLNNMSHEVRTPLNAIIGFSTLFTEPDYSKEELKEFAARISSASKKLISIVEDVVEISEIQTHQVKLLCREFDLMKELREISGIFSVEAEQGNIIFEPVINSPSDSLMVYADRHKLMKIIWHLLDNAFKFTSKGYVKFDCNVASDRIIFRISDTGIGITEELREAIMEPFHQVETGNMRNYGGNGLGLPLVRSYVDLMRGSLSLESEPGKGTSVSVDLPLNCAPRKEALKSDSKEYVQTKTILVAEDDPSNWDYIKIVFSRSDVMLLHACNGQEAVDLCRANPNIDLVFMDIKMPLMDGMTAAMKIKQLRPGLRIVAQTAFANEADKARFLESGFYGYIVKPISWDQYLSLIR
ncbi:MAG: PAS domain S-box protein [Alphaproteobacteria bacterium]|nr:PAS domain S-box protein [Alphaproteobacteria bacterium]